MGKSFMEKRCDPKWVAGMTSRSGVGGGALWFIALVFAILGIVADGINGSLGLEATSWFLLSIALFVAGLSFWISWALGVYFKGTGAKSKE